MRGSSGLKSPCWKRPLERHIDGTGRLPGDGYEKGQHRSARSVVLEKLRVFNRLFRFGSHPLRQINRRGFCELISRGNQDFQNLKHTLGWSRPATPFPLPRGKRWCNRQRVGLHGAPPVDFHPFRHADDLRLELSVPAWRKESESNLGRVANQFGGTLSGQSPASSSSAKELSDACPVPQRPWSDCRGTGAGFEGSCLVRKPSAQPSRAAPQGR